MDAELWRNISLVVATALTTGGVSLLVAWQQNRFAERRASADREAAAEQLATEHSREHALRINAVMEDMLAIGLRRQREGESTPPNDEFRESLLVARRNYLLIADAKLRLALADALTVISGGQVRNVELHDWNTACANGAFVVAAHLRHEDLPAEYVDQLANLRARYAPGE